MGEGEAASAPKPRATRRKTTTATASKKEIMALMVRVGQLEDDVNEQIEKIAAALAEMKKTQESMLKVQQEYHAFYAAMMLPALGEQRSLVQKLTVIVDNIESGRRTSINIMGVAGFIAAVGAAWIAIRHTFSPPQ